MATLELYTIELTDYRANELETDRLYLFYINDKIDSVLNGELEDISMMYVESGNLIDEVDLLDAEYVGRKTFEDQWECQDHIHDWYIKYEFNTPVDSIEL